MTQKVSAGQAPPFVAALRHTLAPYAAAPKAPSVPPSGSKETVGEESVKARSPVSVAAQCSRLVTPLAQPDNEQHENHTMGSNISDVNAEDKTQASILMHVDGSSSKQGPAAREDDGALLSGEDTQLLCTTKASAMEVDGKDEIEEAQTLRSDADAPPSLSEHAGPGDLRGTVSEGNIGKSEDCSAPMAHLAPGSSATTPSALGNAVDPNPTSVPQPSPLTAGCSVDTSHSTSPSHTRAPSITNDETVPLQYYFIFW